MNAAPAGSTLDSNAVIAVATLAGVVISAVLTHTFNTSAGRTAARRAGYAQMTRTLIELTEVPYRVRRRTSDSPDALERLASHIHHVQERLAEDQAHLYAEARWLAAAHKHAWNAIRAATAASTVDAWNQPPITAASDMTLAGWGPGTLEDQIRLFTRYLPWRFGTRKMLNPARRLLRAATSCSTRRPTPDKRRARRHRPTAPRAQSTGH